MEINKVVQALKVLQEAGREELNKEGVLEQAWVGLRRPKRSSSDRVSAAVLACKSPVASPKKCRKCKVKSVAGRKVSISPDHDRVEARAGAEGCLPCVSAVRRGAARSARRYGSLFLQRVAAAGRGAVVVSDGCGAGRTMGRSPRARSGAGVRRLQVAMCTCGQMGEGVARASCSKSARAHQVLVPQAPLALESGGENGNQPFEERQLGGATIMAAPSELKDLVVEEENFTTGEGRHMFMAEQANKDLIIIDSEDEGEVLELQIEGGSGISGQFDRGLSVHSERVHRQTPKIISQVGQGVQEWEVEDQSIFRAGGQVFFQDEQGVILKGTICGLASEYGGSGTAQVGQNVLGQDQRAYLSGCVAPHVSSGHGVLVEHQPSGRPAGGPIAVGVRAPPGRRIEERAQSGAVRLTAREVAPLEVRSFESSARGLESRSYSRSAILGGEEEEELDYGDEGEQVAVPQASTSGQAFQGERLSRREVAANLSRGEGFDAGTLGWHAYCVDLFGTSQEMERGIFDSRYREAEEEDEQRNEEFLSRKGVFDLAA
ncbi:hypothetical protein NDU88_010508 [Pleurodeles waltl]|uniref:Uncharacterized protein n=1 Tax=Pleurodeles waltl TaxID=8319 RepID=A0AAV7QY77_PLEWA|nr:hypothetical protein NDU88_010508 [Pleurodeles waltl]